MAQGFDCGSDDYDEPINNWIREWVWSASATKRRRTVIAITESGELAGYGSWTHQPSGDGSTQINIAYFGVDELFQGTVDDESDEKVADRLFTAVEQDALADEGSSPEMPFTLDCDTRNTRGQTFWRRQGFELIPDLESQVVKDRYYRFVR